VVLIVKTSVLRWIGIASVAAAPAVSLVVTGGWLGVALSWVIFGVPGLALILMSATIEATEEMIIVRRILSKAQIRWSDIVAASVGGGNLVLYTENGRVSMPSAEFWSGPHRSDLVALLSQKLAGVGVTISRSVKAAMHVASRSPNKSLERTRER